jgi:outer membrane translocation and assembly module TamA
MGPLRLEYGYPLDDLKDNNGKFEFTIGQFF